MSYRFADSLRAGSGRNWFRPDPAGKLSANLYDIYHYLRPDPSGKLSANLYDIYHYLRPDPAGKLSANLYGIYHCCVYSEKLLMMNRGTVRNM